MPRSPLTSIETPTMTSPTRNRLGDRRSRSRFEIVGQLWGSLETIETLRLRNLGEGGALLETRFSLQVDTVHRLRFASGGQVTDVQARVRYVTAPPDARKDQYLIGMEFLAMPPAAAEHLSKLVRENAAIQVTHAGEARS
jgi:hypothetical protein